MKEKALLLLENRPRFITYQMIAKNTGLTTHWLKSFRSGKFNNPKSIRLERLINFLEQIEHD